MFDYDVYCLEGEVWKDIPTYEGIYQASSFGRIRSVDGKTTESIRHGTRKWKGKILKNKTKIFAKEGCKVSLWKDKKVIDHLVSRLVCSTFHGMPSDFYSKEVITKLTVNHIDGNRFNNRIENIEWLTIGDNIRHGFETGAYAKSQKEVILIKIGVKNPDHEHFNSLSEASRFLGRSNKYLSCQIKRNGVIKSSCGSVFYAKYNWKSGDTLTVSCDGKKVTIEKEE